MERIGTMAVAAVQDERIRTLSPNQPTSTTSIPRDEHAALFSVINKARLLNGWTMRTASELDATIRTWHEAFSLYAIPTSAYGELYTRALDVRQRRMQLNSADVPLIDAALMISQWDGPHGLQADLRRREVAQGRTLTATAPSQCLRCYGTGMENIYNDDGVKIGVKPGCMHEHIDESDPHNAGMAEAQAAVKFVAKAETAVDICRRVQQQLSYIVVTAIGDEGQEAWDASRTWARAERYCRENP